MLHTALIGFPSSGKTTLFRLMTGLHDATRGKAETEIGVARVPDARLDRLTALYHPRKRVPATVEIADPVGPGRTGAQDLLDVAAFRDADALVHVIRSFRDEAVLRTTAIEPARDAQAMEDELILADLAVVERRLDRIERDSKKGQSGDLEKERGLLARCRQTLERGVALRALDLAGDDRKRLRGFQLLSAKPLLLALNVDEADLTEDSGRPAASRLEGVAERAGLGEFLSRAATRAVVVCAKIELEIAQLEAAEVAAFLGDLGLSESGLDRVIRASYGLLGYLTFFTVGDDECRAWSIPRGTTAHLAAGEIHSDIGRGFIRAEVVGYDRLTARGSMPACRSHGEVRLEGKDYVMQDGDVVNFRFAT